MYQKSALFFGVVILILIGVLVLWPAPPPEFDPAEGVKVSVGLGEVLVKNGEDERRLKAGEGVLAHKSGDMIDLTQEENSAANELPKAISQDIAETTAADPARDVTSLAKKPVDDKLWIVGYSQTEQGKPLENTGIIVRVRPSDPPVKTKTDGQGYYAVPVERYKRYSMMAIPQENLSIAMASVDTGEATESVIQNFYHKAAVGGVRGQVVDKETREPVADARISLTIDYKQRPKLEKMKMGLPPRAISDAEGKFEVLHLPAGNYRLEAEAKGYLYFSPKKWNYDPSPLGSIDVSAGSIIEDVVVKLEAGGSLTVRVVDAKGQPVQMARVDVIVDDNRTTAGTTDEKGEWKTDSIAKGNVIVRAEKDGFGESWSNVVKTGTVDVPAEVEIVMKKPGRVSGRVMMKDGSAGSDYRLILYNLSMQSMMGLVYPRQTASTTTAEDGGYSMGDLGEGEYEILVYPKIEGGYSRADSVAEKTIHLAEGQNLENVDFLIDDDLPNEKVTGIVVDQDEQPIEDVHVFCMVQDRQPGDDKTGENGSDWTNEKGEFEVSGLKKVGRIWVSASKDGYKNYREVIPMPVEPIRIQLTEGGGIECLVLAKDTKQPVAHAHLALKCYSNMNYRNKSGMTKEDGTYTFPKQAKGYYKIHAYAKEYANTESELIKVEAGKDASVTIELDPTRIFQGRLVGPEEQPGGRATIALLSMRPDIPRGVGWTQKQEEYPKSVISNADGTFEIAVSANKKETLVIRPNNFAPRTFPITPGQGGEEPVRIPVSLGGTVEGTVYNEKGEPAPNVKLVASDTPDLLFVQSTRTSEKGQYRFEHLPAQRIDMIRFAIPTLGQGRQSKLDREHKQIVVEEGQVHQVDFGGAADAVIQGIVSENGEPVEAASVLIESWRTEEPFAKFDLSNAQGRYILRGVPDGKYRVLFTTNKQEDSLSNYNAEGMREITITSEKKDYTLDLPVQIKEVVGVVKEQESGEPIPWVDIRPKIEVNQGDSFIEHPYPTKAQEDGSFRFVVRRPGTFTLVASKAGYETKEFQVVYSQHNAGQMDEPMTLDIAMEKAKECIEAQFMFEGKPIVLENAYVGSKEPAVLLYSIGAIPERPGWMRITGFEPGSLSLRITGKWDDRMMSAIVDSIAIQEGETRQMTIPVREIVFYKLIFEPSDGAPMPREQSDYDYAIPALPRYSHGPWGGIGSNTSGSYFAAPIPKGPYRVRFTVKGYEPVECIPSEIAEPLALPSWMQIHLPIKKRTP